MTKTKLQCCTTYLRFLKAFVTFILGITLQVGVTHSATEMQIAGIVVAVSDGDTIKVLDTEKVQHTIRLAGIDAPEKTQAYGQRSKESLSQMVFRKNIKVMWSKEDRYGRKVGKIIIEGKDAGLQQIRLGMAWHYRKYAQEQNESDRREYAQAEQSSRDGRRGLWQEENPVPPWDWRKLKKDRLTK